MMPPATSFVYVIGPENGPYKIGFSNDRLGNREVAQARYPVASSAGRGLIEQASEHAALNPGTLRVEDQYGNVLWRSQ